MPSLDFYRDGAEIRRALLSNEIIELVKEDIDLEHTSLKKYGVRNLEKRFQSISKLVEHDSIVSVACDLLKDRVNMVRVIFFDKTPDKNWFVTWHQDKTVTLNKKLRLGGWGPWSKKDNVHHVQPPIPVLESMVTLRLHIDPADERNGCLKVIPGTHKQGIVAQNEIDGLVKNAEVIPCVVEAGDAVIMRPLLLHASSKADQPDHRRVVHIEYSSFELPDGVHWA